MSFGPCTYIDAYICGLHPVPLPLHPNTRNGTPMTTLAYSFESRKRQIRVSSNSSSIRSGSSVTVRTAHLPRSLPRRSSQSFELTYMKLPQTCIVTQPPFSDIQRHTYCRLVSDLLSHCFRETMSENLSFKVQKLSEDPDERKLYHQWCITEGATINPIMSVQTDFSKQRAGFIQLPPSK